MAPLSIAVEDEKFLTVGPARHLWLETPRAIPVDLVQPWATEKEDGGVFETILVIRLCNILGAKKALQM